MRDRHLEQRLRDLPVPDEGAAEERAWGVISAAYAERPSPARPPVRARRLVLALAASLVILALVLTPAGAEVVDVVQDVVGIDEEDTKPALDSLPASGELLVDSGDGAWIVREDGSKRRLGDYDEATWSPRGLFVAAASGQELAAVGPLGEVRWTVAAPAEVRDPRWSPSGYRIAYLSDGDLRVVAGDGTEDRVLARNVAPVAPAWRPIPAAKLQAASGAPGTEQLSYVDEGGRLQLVDADTGEEMSPEPRGAPVRGRRPAREGIETIAWSADGSRFLAATGRRVFVEDLAGNPGARAGVGFGSGLTSARFAPGGGRIAVVRRSGDESEVRIIPADLRRATNPRRVLASPVRLDSVTWSPDGRWLLAENQAADQWLFVRVNGPGRLITIDGISEQFAPGGLAAGFPRVEGWVLPQR